MNKFSAKPLYIHAKCKFTYWIVIYMIFPLPTVYFSLLTIFFCGKVLWPVVLYLEIFNFLIRSICSHWKLSKKKNVIKFYWNKFFSLFKFHEILVRKNPFILWLFLIFLKRLFSDLNGAKELNEEHILYVNDWLIFSN